MGYQLTLFCRERPAEMKKVFRTVAETLMEFSDCSLEAGAEGIFYAALGGERNFFTDEKNIEILDRLKEYGVNMQAEETETVESVLTGKTVVVTGTLPTLGRKEASELIEKYGGKASGSVSKKTDYVLAGENAGSKLTKAQELGIPVISEEQLKEMLGI